MILDIIEKFFHGLCPKGKNNERYYNFYIKSYDLYFIETVIYINI